MVIIKSFSVLSLLFPSLITSRPSLFPACFLTNVTGLYVRQSCMERNEKSHVSAGPWGGECGTRWDDGVFCSIRQMVISHGAVVDAVQIEYDTKGCAVWSEKHGGGGGVKTDRVKLDHPEEYLVSISGHYAQISEYGPAVVRSLVLESNKRRYGPFGFQKGTHFSFSLTGGKIVGFHGRSGHHLDSIGVYLKPFVVVKSAHTQSQAHILAQNRIGAGAGVGGNKGFDIMDAVREKMDNMLISNSAFGEYERKEKVFMSSEAPKGTPNMRQVGREKENYTFMSNVPAFSENDETSNHKLFFPIGSHVKGYPPNARQPIREKDDYMAEYETKEKVYTTGDGLKGRTNTWPSAIDNEDFRLSPDTGFSEYETREKMKGYGIAGGEKGYVNMRETESTNMFIRNKVYGEYETKDQLYNIPENAKGSPSRRQAVSCGPWGGNGGSLFDDGVYTGVREIHLARSTGSVLSIKVCYDLNGQAVWGDKNGGTGGFRLDKITLDYPDDFLTHISGYYGSTSFRGPTVVKSLTFYTNKKKYGPFGDEQGTYFSSGQKDGVIVGFHGRKGCFLDCIGVHFLEGKQSSPRRCFDIYSTTTDMTYNDQKVVPRPAKGPTPCGPGLLQPGMVKSWGGDGGSTWDDGVFTGIKKIFLAKGEEAIYAIQIEYDRNGQSMWSVKHGSNNEGSSHVIQFEYPHEVLTCISGYYGPIRGDECKKVVKSLTFHTNRGRYGPYGEEIGTYFTSAKTEGKIVGFHGKSGFYLYAIGVHTQHWMNNRVEQRPIKMMLNRIFS